MAKEFICKSCGWSGDRPVCRERGSAAVEVALWLCLLVPGLIYSLWRRSTGHDACPSCGSIELVPIDSPIGRRLAGELGIVRRPRPVPAPPSRGAVALGRRVGRLFARR